MILPTLPAVLHINRSAHDQEGVLTHKAKREVKWRKEESVGRRGREEVMEGRREGVSE